MIFEPIACLAQTVHLSCVLINTISKWTKMSFHLSVSPRRFIGCSQKDFHAHGTFGTNRVPIWRRDEHLFQAGQSELPLDVRHLEVPLCMPKMIFESIEHSMQTVHLSCVEISTIFKETEMSFHLTHVI
jgi:hypothetical protein